MDPVLEGKKVRFNLSGGLLNQPQIGRRLCGLFGGVEGLKQLRSGDHSPQLRRRMLMIFIRSCITEDILFGVLTLFASVAIHVSLQRAWSCETLVTNLALVLLLCARRDLGAELAHHGLGRRRH